MRALTHEQVRLFRHNGFLKLPGRIPELTVSALKNAIHHDLDHGIEPVVTY